jgi:hypothetical protein
MVTMALLFVFSVVLGVLELPFCCMWFPQCKTLATFLKIFEIYWLRAILYLALATTMIAVAVNVDQNNAATWYFGLILPIISILYCLASYRGEKSSLDETTPASPNTPAKPHEGGVERAAAKSDAPAPTTNTMQDVAIAVASDRAVQSAAINVAAKNPDLLRDALRAAAGSRV